MTVAATAAVYAWHEQLTRLRQQLLELVEELDDDRHHSAIGALHEAERQLRSATRAMTRAVKALG